MSTRDDWPPIPETPSAAAETIATTVDHIEQILEKENKLRATREDAENQVFYALGHAYRSGDINFRELHAQYLRFRAMNIPGFGGRWDANVGISTIDMTLRGRCLPNGPEGTWVGRWPMTLRESFPAPGYSVVYVLFDEANEPCYVGSTNRFRTRLNEHDKAGKEFANWQAYPCDTREHAYQLEERLLKQHLPKLNLKIGR